MKNGNASEMSTRQFGELVAIIVRSLPPDMSPAIGQKWIESQQRLKRVLRDSLMSLKDAFLLRNISDGRTTEQLAIDGKYSYVNPDVSSKNFPARPRKNGLVEIVFIEGKEFDDQCLTSEKVLKEAKKRGLRRPVYEDALYFGEEHPEVQKEGAIIFLHEPVLIDGILKALIISTDEYGRRVLYTTSYLNEWARHCRFAFVRKQNK